MMVPEELVARGAEAARQMQRKRLMEDVTSRQAGTYWIDKADDLARAVLEAVYTTPKAVGWYCPECASVSRDPGRHYTRCSKPAVVPVFIEIPGAESEVAHYTTDSMGQPWNPVEQAAYGGDPSL